MTSAELLIDAFGRIRGVVHGAVDALTPEQLAHRIGGRSNSVAWLVWHLTRIQDDHLAGVADTEQVWPDWAPRFDLPLDLADTGYGHRSDQVDLVRVSSGELLTGYYDAVHERSLRFLGTLTDSDLPRIVDTAWDPPVTLGVRLISVVSDNLQHAGQAAFIRGLLP